MEFLPAEINPTWSFWRHALHRLKFCFDGPVLSVNIQSDTSVASREPVMASYSGENDDEAIQSVPPSTRKRSKKRKIYCFNCNRQEFHIMAYKGTWLHSFLVGMSFGLARIFGPYRCTCCGKKRAMFADFCSLSYHWRKFNERRLSGSSRRRSSRSSRSSRSKRR